MAGAVSFPESSLYRQKAGQTVHQQALGQDNSAEGKSHDCDKRNLKRAIMCTYRAYAILSAMATDTPDTALKSPPATALQSVPSLKPTENPAPVTPWHELAAGVAFLIQAAKAPNTLRAYRADWQHFSTWCGAREVPALPAAPETIAFYLADLAGQGRKPATLRRKLTALGRAHEAKGFASLAAATSSLVIFFLEK
jgi:hypothetical protein